MLYMYEGDPPKPQDDISHPTDGGETGEGSGPFNDRMPFLFNTRPTPPLPAPPPTPAPYPMPKPVEDKFRIIQ